MGAPDVLSEVLESAISATTANLSLVPGRAPSSTVLMVRADRDQLNVLALGDSTVIVSVNGRANRVTDDRLASVGTALRRQYVNRLAAGSGYDDEHARLLRRLQERELVARNVPGGYWIAETNSQAAEEATTRTFHVPDVDWCVLATDGFERPVEHLGIAWSDIARMNGDELSDLLHSLHRWEEHSDPDGFALPRAKRHDDKTVVVWPGPQR
ncbi:hypothetical protein [Saccharothrix violaceirubra]|uniref:Serine/threonine protein phosphatase PrpC n=1 Tax=Saccharothrix violaceirubra TaxID=413306 RepID=A0A7W7WXX7_9PSEU|nr:serine/threonine protein phosphatase PrpC [Saccharothrix violaceirubra]